MQNLQFHWYDLIFGILFLLAYMAWRERILEPDGHFAFRLRWGVTFLVIADVLAFYSQEILVWSAVAFLLAAPKLMQFDQVGLSES